MLFAFGERLRQLRHDKNYTMGIVVSSDALIELIIIKFFENGIPRNIFYRRFEKWFENGYACGI